MELKISPQVVSFNTRNGAVVPATNDYTWAQIDKTTSDIANIATKSHTSLSDIGTNTHALIDTHIAGTGIDVHGDSYVLNTGDTMTGQLLLSVAGSPLVVTNTLDTAGALCGNFRHLRATPTDLDQLDNLYTFYNSTPTTTIFARIRATAVTVTAGAEDSALSLIVNRAGTEVTKLWADKTGVGIGNTSPTDQLDISKSTGGSVSIGSRDLTIDSAGELFGQLQFYTSDTQVTTSPIAASIVVQSSASIGVDAAKGDMIFNVAGTVPAAAIIEHMRFTPTTVAKIGFFGATPVIKPTALTTALTTITVPAYTIDTAIQAVTSTTPFGFVNANEGNTVIASVRNLMLRVAEIETKLTDLGLLTA